MKKILHRYISPLKGKNLAFLLTLIIVGIFVSIVLPLCFNNNDYLNLVYANNVDSGSILSSIISMSSLTGLYNQNLMYHGFYGYPYNSLVFLVFVILKVIGMSPMEHFSIFATAARLISLFIAVLVIFQLYKLSALYIKKWYVQAGYILLVVMFAPFFFYSFQLKQDLFGLYFSLLCLSNLSEFYLFGKKETIWKCILFFTLATLNKQPFIFLMVPLGLVLTRAYLGRDKAFVLQQAVKGVFLSIILTFLIHPYLFLDFDGFIEKQSMLFNGNIAQSMVTTAQEWLRIIYNSHYLLAVSFAPLFFLLYNGVVLVHRKTYSANKENFLTVSVAIYILVYVSWLILKVGPLKTDAYFLPVYSYSLLLIAIVLDNITRMIINIKTKITYTGSMILYFIIIAFLFLPIVATNLQQLYGICMLSYTFKTTSVVKFADEVNKYKFRQPTQNINIVHTVSIPINSRLFQSVKNTWQFGNINSIQNTICITQKPDVVVIDKRYPYEMDIDLWTMTLTKCNMINRYPDNSKFALFY